MSNANKCKGDRFESAALLIARDYFGQAQRTRAGWDDDRGDILLTRDFSIIQQVKDCKARPWYSWLDELDMQKCCAGARWACVVAKRPGKSDAGEAMAIMRNRDWLAMAARIHDLELALSHYQYGQSRAVIPEWGKSEWLSH